ncbi:MAG: hypothetical protein AAF533_15840 [Acidobacteriota bacterium]
MHGRLLTPFVRFVDGERLLRLGILAPLALLLAFSGADRAHAQGRTDYYNVESPQVHPIELAAVPEMGNPTSTKDFLLVVNTPDNALEIYGTDGSLQIASQFITRVRTGIEPVSVRWIPQTGRFYVANFLGDSITSGALEWSGSKVEVSDIQTVEVIDEPLDMVFFDDPTGTLDLLVVTHMTLDTLGLYDPLTLETVEGPYSAPPSGTMDTCHVEVDPACETDPISGLPVNPRFRRFVPTGTNDVDGDGMLTPADDMNGDGGLDPDDFTLAMGIDTFALKQPWTAAVSCDRLFVLGHLGGSHLPRTSMSGGDFRGFRYDTDLWSQAASSSTTLLSGPGSPIAQSQVRGGFGSTNWNMQFAGGSLYAVGGNAQNRLNGELAVAAAPTGFVQSSLYVLANPCALGVAPSIQTFDLNSNYTCTGGTCTQGSTVAPNQALAQPTDLAVRTVGGVTQVFVAAFGSDRVGRIDIGTNSYVRNVGAVWPASGLPMAGPRGLALHEPSASGSIDRLFVFSRLTNAINVLDPDTLTHLEWPVLLQNDPTPHYVKTGRSFLYDARLSGNGFDSCASCHVDGRTDGIAWDLSGPVPNPTIPPQLLVVDNTDVSPTDMKNPSTFFPNKRFMVTQSLQGLLNHEVPPIGDYTTSPTESQRLVTNAPYHWRGDRDTFLDFNGAFMSLLGASSELSSAQMDQFEEFINSIHYPPNPKQARDRRFTGEANPALTDPPSALEGLRLFHTTTTVPIGPPSLPSCAHCHALPEGSDNTLTLPDGATGAQPHPIGMLGSTNPVEKPLEGAALRGLFQKEARREVNATTPLFTGPLTGFEGLSHAGLSDSGLSNDHTLNDFVINAFPGLNPRNASVAQLLHEFDFGTGPIVGRTFTVSRDDVLDFVDEWDLAEAQADEANAGLAVQGFFAGYGYGFYYDPSSDATSSTGEPLRYWLQWDYPTTFPLTRSQVMGFLRADEDRLVVISTPLGSERRIASTKGTAHPLKTGPLPTNLSFEPMVPNTAYECVPSFTAGWLPETNVIPNTAHTILLYQTGLLFSGPLPGGNAPHHVVPRRFRVAGDGIVHGARLHLLTPDDQPPNPGLPHDDPNQAPMVHLELPLHATTDRAHGVPIWETSVEIDPLFVYRMMAGRPTWSAGSGVPSTLMASIADLDYRVPGVSPHVHHAQPSNVTFTTFNPSLWNRHYAWIVNGDGQRVDLGWVGVTAEPVPATCP